MHTSGQSYRFVKALKSSFVLKAFACQFLFVFAIEADDEVFRHGPERAEQTPESLAASSELFRFQATKDLCGTGLAKDGALFGTAFQTRLKIAAEVGKLGTAPLEQRYHETHSLFRPFLEHPRFAEIARENLAGAAELNGVGVIVYLAGFHKRAFEEQQDLVNGIVDKFLVEQCIRPETLTGRVFALRKLGMDPNTYKQYWEEFETRKGDVAQVVFHWIDGMQKSDIHFIMGLKEKSWRGKRFWNNYLKEVRALNPDSALFATEGSLSSRFGNKIVFSALAEEFAQRELHTVQAIQDGLILLSGSAGAKERAKIIHGTLARLEAMVKDDEKERFYQEIMPLAERLDRFLNNPLRATPGQIHRNQMVRTKELTKASFLEGLVAALDQETGLISICLLSAVTLGVSSSFSHNPLVMAGATAISTAVTAPSWIAWCRRKIEKANAALLQEKYFLGIAVADSNLKNIATRLKGAE